MRIDKYIGNSTDLSRKQVKAAIKNGWVEINGKIIRDPACHVADLDTVTLDGDVIASPGPRYFMLHKPQGVVCANKDQNNITALDLLADEPNHDKLHIAGRLDIDTTGLVLITDDGQWTHRVISPTKQCPKVYYVETLKTIDESCIAQFKRGIMLNGEKKRCQPASLERLDSDRCLLTIHEGKYHQVKRMFAAQGNQVIRLHRQAVGAITLDSDLAEAEYRPLTKSEIHSIK